MPDHIQRLREWAEFLEKHPRNCWGEYSDAIRWAIARAERLAVIEERMKNVRQGK